MKSCLTKDPGHGSVYKEVRFSPTVTPAMNPSSTLESDYLDQLRSLLEHQRANFETERARERQLWETERALLKSRISELESSLNGSRDGGAVHHNHHRNADNYSDSVPTNTSSQVWEGSSPGGQPTRVFHEKGKSLDEGSSTSLSLDEALSTQSRATTDVSAAVPVPVPIEKLDSKLDGITLKSSALPPEVVARVMTPPSPSPSQSPSSSASQEPSPPPSQKSPAEHKHTHTHTHILKLKLEELGPPDRNLTRDAGHTPMAAVVDATPTEDDANKTDDGEEVGQPTEKSDSYFPDLPEDPALKGPLSLLNEEEHDRGFLNELNQKLLDETRQAPSSPSSDNPSGQGQEKDIETPIHGEQDPELKFKDTKNFGTAFGESKCGNVGP